MVFPKSEHYYYPKDYVKDYTYKPHVNLFTSLSPIRLGGTVRCIATFYDKYGILEDPDSAPTINIYDPTATLKVTDGTMTEDGDYNSTYYYNHDIGSSDKAGLWRFKVTATLTIDSDEWDYIESLPFQVFKALG